MQRLFFVFVTALLIGVSMPAFAQDDKPYECPKNLEQQRKLLDEIETKLKSPDVIETKKIDQFQEIVQAISENGSISSVRNDALLLNIELLFKYDIQNVEEKLNKSIAKSFSSIKKMNTSEILRRVKFFGNISIELNQKLNQKIKPELVKKIMASTKKAYDFNVIEINKLISVKQKDPSFNSVVEFGMLHNDLILKIAESDIINWKGEALNDAAFKALKVSVEKSKNFYDSNLKNLTREKLESSIRELIKTQSEEEDMALNSLAKKEAEGQMEEVLKKKKMIEVVEAFLVFLNALDDK